MNPMIWLLVAVVAGWMVQLYASYQQSMAFNRSVQALRKDGAVTVGSGGRRYRGGRAFVALAVDDDDVVRNALTLRGFTTFARSRPLPVVLDLPASRLRGEGDVPGLSVAEREATRQAATLLAQSRARAST